MRKLLSFLWVFFLVFTNQRIEVKASFNCHSIASAEELMGMFDSNSDYCLISDIDMSAVSNFEPLLNSGTFTGTLNGNGFAIRNLNINGSMPTINIGLFAQTDGAIFENLKFENFNYILNGDPSLTYFIGLFSGTSQNTVYSQIEIINSRITTNENVAAYVGGLVGSAYLGVIQDSSIDFNYSGGGQYVGGMIGTQLDGLTMSRVSVNTNLNNGVYQAGLIGSAYGNETLTSKLNLSHIDIKGDIIGESNIAALFGDLFNYSEVSLVDVTTKLNMATSDPTSTNYLINDFAVFPVSNVTLNLTRYLAQNKNTSNLSSTLFSNGLDGFGSRTITDSYYLESQAGLTSIVTSPLDLNTSMLSTNYINFDFDNTWVIHPFLNEGVPYLRQSLDFLTFDSLGGNFVSTQPYFINEVIPQQPNPSKEGYTFEGWFRDSGFTQIFDFTSTTHDRNQTLYAKWFLLPTSTSETPNKTPHPQTSVQPELKGEPIPNTGVKTNASFFGVILGVALLLISKKK